jgi:hypothetical protein
MQNAFIDTKLGDWQGYCLGFRGTFENGHWSLGNETRSLSENRKTSCGRGDLAPTLTKIIKPLIVPNAAQALTVKLGAKLAVSPPAAIFSLKITNFAFSDRLLER